LAAFLLLVFGKEDEAGAYACFEVLVTDVLEGYYSPTMALLRVRWGRWGCRARPPLCYASPHAYRQP
jgi:hypothetical protein